MAYVAGNTAQKFLKIISTKFSYTERKIYLQNRIK